MSAGTLRQIANLDEETRRYVLNFTVGEAIALGNAELVMRALTDPGFLEAKCHTGWGGVGRLLPDLQAARGAAILTAEERSRIADVARVMESEQQNLVGWDMEARPAYFGQQVRNRAAALEVEWLRELAEADLRERKLPYLEQAWLAESASRALSKTLVAATAQIHAVRVSEDGRLVYTVGTDGLLRVWEVATGVVLRAIPMDAHKDRVRSLAVAPRGDLAVTGGRDKRICIWNLKTGGLAAALDGHEDWVSDVAVSADGAFAASASYDETVRLWDCRGYRVEKVFGPFGGRVRAVAFTPDGGTLLAGDERGGFHLLELGGSGSGQTLLVEGAVIDRIAVDREGGVAALSCEPAEVLALREDLARETPGLGFSYWEDEFRGGVAGMRCQLVELAGRVLGRSFAFGEQGARAITFLGGGESLAAGQMDSRIAIYAVDSGERIGLLAGHEKAVTSVAFAAGAGIAASGGNDGTVRIWDLRHGPGAATGTGYEAPVAAAAISPDGQWGLTVSTAGELRQWALGDGRVAQRVDLNEGVEAEVCLRTFAFAGASGVLAAASDGAVVLYGKEGLEPIEIGMEARDSILSLSVAVDGKAIGCVTNRGIAYWIDGGSGEYRRVFEKEHLSGAMPVSELGWILARTDDEVAIEIRSAGDGSVIATLDCGKKENVQTFALTPNASAVFVSHEGGAVRLWRLGERKQVKELRGGATATAVSAVVGASRAATAESNRMVTLWNVKEERVMAEARPFGRCFAIAITPRGDGFLAGDTAGNVCFYRYVSPD